MKRNLPRWNSVVALSQSDSVYMVSPRRSVAAAGAVATWTVLLLSAGACVQSVQRTVPPSANITVVDLTPKFLAFYDSARILNADPDQRWQLWRQLYNFAAVPPTAFGDELARRLLDSAWVRYPAAISVIRRGAQGLGVSPDTVLREVITLLGCGNHVRVRLTVFVGGFEGNAFAFRAPDGMPSIALPAEAGDPARSMIHEFTHAAHRGGCATFKSGYGGSLGELVVTEGLAMRVVERLLPGHDANYYTNAAPGWLEAAGARRDSILRGVRERLEDRGDSTWERFTFGTGVAGLRREAYYVGWEVVGAMLTRMHMSFHSVATTPPAQYSDLVRQVIDSLLAPEIR